VTSLFYSKDPNQIIKNARHKLMGIFKKTMYRPIPYLRYKSDAFDFISIIERHKGLVHLNIIKNKRRSGPYPDEAVYIM
jgi:hypothetical protein